jgi:hypothetical protein
VVQLPQRRRPRGNMLVLPGEGAPNGMVATRDHRDHLESVALNSTDLAQTTGDGAGQCIAKEHAPAGAAGHRGKGHHHWLNPANKDHRKAKRNAYLDKYGNPVSEGHDASHPYP